MKNLKDGRRPSASFVAGAVALVFLIVGYQAALFIHKASVTRIIANHDSPDTVFIYGQMSDSKEAPDDFSESTPSGGTVRKASSHSPGAEQIRRANTPRRYESFRFDPNTASLDDLMRLGFSLKQAESIDNYRKKGGRFRRKTDFAKSYVVEDSVYRRLEPFIDIPKLDLNTADSAAFETLPGIGKFYAAKMVSYREELGGYSHTEQLMELWRFDREKFSKLEDLVCVRKETCTPYPLWDLSENELARHPYIDRNAAHGIVVFRDNNPSSGWTVENLRKAGVLSEESGEKLSRCLIAPAP